MSPTAKARLDGMIARFDECADLIGSCLTKADKALMEDNPNTARMYVWYARRILDPKGAALAEEYDPEFAVLLKSIEAATKVKSQ